MKKKYIWLFEILIWLFIISCSFYFFVYNTTIKGNVLNTYYLFFDDVEGLVKGSPVRLMGINIGYVRDVKIFDNKVFVSFLVTKDDVSIPNMASASVEFYGLGGSTSLEINPKTSSAMPDKEAIIPVESYRVQDFWDGQKLAADVLIDIYGGFGRKVSANDVIRMKPWIKQSGLVKEISNITGNINNEQTVIIYKLSESTIDFVNKKQKEKELEELLNKEENLQSEEVEINE